MHNDLTHKLLVVAGQEGNPLAHLLPLQEWILAHLNLIAFWWIVWITTFLYLLYTYILSPLIARHKNKKK